VLDAVFADSWQGKDLKAVVARVIEEYAKISHLSSRDAKHTYLELVAAAGSYGCETFYTVKEASLALLPFLSSAYMHTRSGFLLSPRIMMVGRGLASAPAAAGRGATPCRASRWQD
jgi:hypothetical protein